MTTSALSHPRTTISVVIPVKDDEEMLEKCLLSLVNQRRPADEVIVVDNGSTDGSAEVARRYGCVVITEHRPGITAAASAGYDHARGDIIARCDADSRLPFDWLQRIEGDFAAHPDAAGVTGPGTFYDLGPAANLAAGAFYMRGYFLAAGAALANVPLFGSNFAIRKEIWQSVSGSVPRDKPEIHDDFDLSYRLSPNHHIRYIGALKVGISGRPFRNVAAMRRRVAMAGATMAQHWPSQAPLMRWVSRFTRQTLQPSGESQPLATAPRGAFDAGSRTHSATDEGTS